MAKDTPFQHLVGIQNAESPQKSIWKHRPRTEFGKATRLDALETQNSLSEMGKRAINPVILQTLIKSATAPPENWGLERFPKFERARAVGGPKLDRTACDLTSGWDWVMLSRASTTSWQNF